MLRNFFPKLGMAVKIVEVTVIRLRAGQQQSRKTSPEELSALINFKVIGNKYEFGLIQ